MKEDELNLLHELIRIYQDIFLKKISINIIYIYLFLSTDTRCLIALLEGVPWLIKCRPVRCITHYIQTCRGHVDMEWWELFVSLLCQC